MYIKNIHIGSPDADTPRNAVFYDWDNVSTRLRSAQNTYATPSFYSAVIDNEVISDFAIKFSCDRIKSPNGGEADWRESNITIVRSLGFSDYDDPNGNLFPFLIQYTNSLTPIPNRTNIEYQEISIDANTAQPENWEIERSQCYYMLRLHTSGGGTNGLYNHEQIPPEFYDWNTLRTYCVTNEIDKIYYNNTLAFKCYLGTAEKGVTFNVGKSDGTSITPTANCGQQIFCRSSWNYAGAGSSTPPAYYSIGAIRNTFSDSLSNSQFVMPAAQAGGISTVVSGAENNAFGTTDETNTTNNNKITDCSVIQFGQFKYLDKIYTGFWTVYYTNEYYWGYYRIGNSGTWSFSRLDLANPVSYNTDTMKGQIAEIHFYGFRADVLDLLVETEDGEVPSEPTPPSGNYPTFTHRMMGDASFGLLAGPNDPGFHVYCLDTANFSKLASTLWNWQNFGAILNQELQEEDDEGHPILGFISSWISTVGTTLIDQKVDPSACIVFCRKMPKFVCDKSSGNWAVRIGGSANFGIYGSIFSNERLTWTTSTTIQIESPTQTYLDLDPYVKTSLYLPYVGMVPIETDSFVGGSINIGYASDIMSGLCSVIVICVNKKGQYKTYGPFVGDPSIQVPLAIQDSNAMGRSFGIAKAATSALISATGGAGLAMLSASEGLTDAIMAKQHGQEITSTGSNSGMIVPTEIMVQMSYPEPVSISDTQLKIGVSSYQPGTVENFLTPGTNTPVKFSFIDKSGLTCTVGEANEIESILKEGIIV